MRNKELITAVDWRFLQVVPFQQLISPNTFNTLHIEHKENDQNLFYLFTTKFSEIILKYCIEISKESYKYYFKSFPESDLFLFLCREQHTVINLLKRKLKILGIIMIMVMVIIKTVNALQT